MHVICLQHVKAISVVYCKMATFVLILLKMVTSYFTDYLYVGNKV